jgi:hypothetical protein
MDLLEVFPDGPSSAIPHIIVSDPEGILYFFFPLYIADFVSVLEMSEDLADPLLSHQKKLRESTHFVDTP